MTNSAITPAEWKEIEGYLLERPQCSIDETGAIWLRSSNHGLTCMHPRTFLDICRDPSGSGYREPIQNVASVVYQDDLAIVEDLGPCLTVAGIRAIKKQLMGTPAKDVADGFADQMMTNLKNNVARVKKLPEERS